MRLPPARDPAVEDIEDEGGGRQRGRDEKVAERLGLQEPHRAEDAADAAAPFASVKKSARWNSRIIEKCLGVVVIAVLDRGFTGSLTGARS